MDYEEKAFDFTPARVAGAAKFAREHSGQWSWRDSSPGSRLFLVAGQRSAAYYARTKKDGVGKKIRLGEAEGVAALTLTEARERAGQARFGAEMPVVRRSKGTRAGITTGEVWDRYLAEAKAGTFSLRRRGNRPLSPKTVRGYESNYTAHVKEKYCDRDLGHLVADAVGLVRKVAGPDEEGIPHPALGNQVLATLVALIEYARRRGHYTGKNPLKDADAGVRSHVESREVILTEAQIVALYKALAKQPEYWRDLLFFLSLTANRLSNGAGLKWSQVDLAAGVIVHPRSSMKAKKAVADPITPEIREILGRRRKATGPDATYVWPQAKDPTKPVRNPHHRWEKIRSDAGLPDLVIHGLKHLAVSWADQAGISSRVVQRFAKHGDAATTARYSHLRPEDSIPAVQAVAGVWAKAAKKTRRVKQGRKAAS
jgi:integrase